MPDATEPVLHAEGLRKRFGSVVAVDGVDLEIAPGASVALLGPNGAGKTTTLFMLLGVVTPDEGTVTIAGHRLPHGRATAMQEVGFAAGYLPLPDRVRVREFLALFARMQGMRKPGPAVEAALDRFGISHLSEAMGAGLSSGQRTLVGIVKAVIHRPRLLVLDEPTASLDPDVAQRVRAGLQSLCQDDGTALLVTSHNMVEVERIAERVVFLSAGRVVADGTADEVAATFGRGNLEDVFLHLAAGGIATDAHEETDHP